MIKWEDGEKVSSAYVNEDGSITPAVYNGKTPLSAYNLNKMQQLVDVYRGNYITARTIDGFGKIKSIYGNLNQNVTEQGKNICPTDFNDWESGHYAAKGDKEDDATRIRLKKLIKVNPSTTYYFSTSSTTYLFVMRTYDSTGAFLSSKGAIQANTTITTGASDQYISIAIYNSGGSTETFSSYKTLFENGTLKPFICLNTETDKTYEEFSPDSPSPDYPSQPKVVGDNINLFDKTTITESVGISYDTGAEYSNETIFSTDYISINGIENLVWNGSSSSTNTWGAIYDENKTYLQGINVTDKKINITNTSAKYIRLTFLNEYLDTLKIEQGTVPTGYTSYGCGGIDYKTVTKNLCNCITTHKYISSSGAVTDGDEKYLGLNENIKITPNTQYTITFFDYPEITSANKLYIAYYDFDNKFIERVHMGSLRKFTTLNNAYYIFAYLYNSNGGFTKIGGKVQIEYGDKATEYVENQEKDVIIELPQGEFLAKIGDVQDYIDNQGLLHKYIKKSVGSELGWRLGGTQNFEDSVIFYSNIKDAKHISNANENIKSTHLKNGNPYNDNLETIGIMSTGEIGIRIKTTIASTLEEFIAWLDENTVEIYYELATPYTVQCDFVNIFPQYNEQTNIICETEIEVETNENEAISSIYQSIGMLQEKLLKEV